MKLTLVQSQNLSTFLNFCKRCSLKLDQKILLKAPFLRNLLATSRVMLKRSGCSCLKARDAPSRKNAGPFICSHIICSLCNNIGRIVCVLNFPG